MVEKEPRTICVKCKYYYTSCGRYDWCLRAGKISPVTGKREWTLCVFVNTGDCSYYEPKQMKEDYSIGIDPVVTEKKPWWRFWR